MVDYMDKKHHITIKNGQECIIRGITENDIPQVAAVINSVAEERLYIANEGIKDIKLFKKHLWEQIQSGYWIFMVAELDGKIVGDFNLQIGSPSNRKHTAYIASLLIKEYRNLGIGSAMIQIATEKAKENNMEKLCLSVFSSNIGAINFYKKCGFEMEGVLKKQFKIDGKYVDEVYMAKWL